MNSNITIKSLKINPSKDAIQSVLFSDGTFFEVVDKVDAPTFTLNGSTKKLTITSAAGAFSFYKKNSADDAFYSSTITVAKDDVIKAYSIKEEMANSNIVTFTVEQAEKPTISYDSVTGKVTITGTGTIKYKVNTGSYAAYTEPFAVEADDVVKAYCEVSQKINSEEETLTIE